jgi:ABC-type bacteriocin/lantibiotic exporter with double-glycine peptidase domain
MSWIPQHPHLFATSVSGNIALGNPAASREDIERAARAAGAAAFIENLPQGYGTELGERGLTLSSGQRQQIALARAFFRDAPLLLLDEPAVHLDAASAGRLDTVISTLMAGRTVIQVTHAQSRARNTGRVFLLDQGRLRQAIVPLPASAAFAPVAAAS